MEHARRPLARVRKRPDGLWEVRTTERWNIGEGSFLGVSPKWGKAVKKANAQADWWLDSFGKLEETMGWGA